MKSRASRFLKQVIADLSSMAKSKTLAFKSKRNAIKARLIILSLVMNKKFVISSISHKFQSFLGHHSHPKVEYLLEGVSDMKTQELVEDKDQNDGYESYYNYDEDYDYDYDFDDENKCKYQDFTHTLFDSEDLDLGGSKEEAMQELKMEEEIDKMADIFIKKFHRQILLQKQESLKRCQGMLLSGVA